MTDESAQVIAEDVISRFVDALSKRSPGFLQKDELHFFISQKRLPIPQDELDDLFTEADSNKDGAIETGELVRLLVRHQRKAHRGHWIMILRAWAGPRASIFAPPSPRLNPSLSPRVVASFERGLNKLGVPDVAASARSFNASQSPRVVELPKGSPPPARDLVAALLQSTTGASVSPRRLQPQQGNNLSPRAVRDSQALVEGLINGAIAARGGHPPPAEAINPDERARLPVMGFAAKKAFDLVETVQKPEGLCYRLTGMHENAAFHAIRCTGHQLPLLRETGAFRASAAAESPGKLAGQLLKMCWIFCATSFSTSLFLPGPLFRSASVPQPCQGLRIARPARASRCSPSDYRSTCRRHTT